MSRMDRNKKIHEESEKVQRKEERKKKAFRREKTTDEFEKETTLHNKTETEAKNDNFLDTADLNYLENLDNPFKQKNQQREYQKSTYQEPIQKNKKRFPLAWKKKTKDPNQPRKKRNWKKNILRILIFLIGYSLVTFAIGNFQAKHDATMPAIETQEFAGAKSEDGTSNILLLGSDTRDNVSGRSDSMMVLQVDGSGKPKLVSFMRDMYVSIPGVGENKLNAAYAYGGADLVRQTLLENFGINCRYYAMVDFQTFEKGIDALFSNGVKIDAEKDMSSYIDEPISQGEQQMNGHTLLNYARFRMDEEGDFGRVRRQQQVMTAVSSQIKNPLVLIKAPYAMGKVFGYLSTDISNFYIFTHLFGFAKMAGGIDRLTLPVDGSWSYIDTDNAGSALDVDNATNSAQVQAFLAK
ncbi:MULTISPECIES: LCP family protein [Enterococcus]|uniref:Regulatory protein MsrR n=1 Tax=Enterococcus alishanensis TaxID=1303817 RepID=A0ABS6TBE6_9ENTE|nr:LCP family protein [Enterococcus alishanensis]MBV7390229.1 LCP family protein [Enterococcus alishanensis]